jgi:hypothetical protein
MGSVNFEDWTHEGYSILYPHADMYLKGEGSEISITEFPSTKSL